MIDRLAAEACPINPITMARKGGVLALVGSARRAKLMNATDAVRAKRTYTIQTDNGRQCDFPVPRPNGVQVVSR